ncbi:MAG: hypothetical protein EBU90_01410 [Proteobacteria bacterium]|nr:hypothetical protein [Pseudomonadota bacterium]
MLPTNYTWLTEEQVRNASRRTRYWEMYLYNTKTQKGKRKRGWILHEMLEEVKKENLKIAVINEELRFLKT